MGWIKKMCADYFMALGFMVFCGFMVAIFIFDGKVSEVNTGIFFVPPIIFAWLRGELVHWPREIIEKSQKGAK